MKKGIILWGLMAAAISGTAQTEVNDYTPGINAEGVTYFLPKTLIEIVLEAEKEVYTPGEFCEYANKYLRLQGISKTPGTTWNIKKMTVEPVGTRDPQKGFTVKLRDKSIASLMELTEEGVLLSINRASRAEASPSPASTTEKEANPRDFLSEEILSSTSTAKMAELVAKEIYNIRESRNAILRGQADNAPKDGEALKLILANLEEQETALMAMFKGKTVREKKEFTIQLTPDSNRVEGDVLFRFSNRLGVLDANDLSGSPVYYDLRNQTDLPRPIEGKKTKKAKRPQGIVYNIPGKALLKIYDNKETLYEGELPVAQYGNTDVLATDLFNKGVNTRITFDPGTGAIRKIERE